MLTFGCQCLDLGPAKQRLPEPAMRGQVPLSDEFGDSGDVDAEDRRGLWLGGEEVLDLDSRPGVGEIIHAEWAAHVAPYEAGQQLGVAAQRFREAERQLAEAVAQARAAGNSWETIGGRLGVTRQSAHERWASRTAQ